MTKAMGRPLWEPTDEERRLVEHYVTMGYTQEQIAALMDKSVDSLDRHCRTELNTGMLRTNAKVGGKLFQKAMSGDTAAMIFWMKTRARWKETSVQELTGKDGDPIAMAAAVKLEAAPQEVLEWLASQAPK